MRGRAFDTGFKSEDNLQRDEQGKVYKGTVLEHILIENLTAFYEVGEHNNIKLRDADWNDAIDMASDLGESVAFTNAYAMNLRNLGELLKREKELGVKSITLLEEIKPLINCPTQYYSSPSLKNKCLKEYAKSVKKSPSGRTTKVAIDKLIEDLFAKAEALKEHIRMTEWIDIDSEAGFYNGYYDNSGKRVEGLYKNNNVRMMLTSQVFSVMGQTADKNQIEKIVKAADRYLYDEDCGGYRLNSNFNELKTDMGRMFGFAYGEKENGAVFSHMAVMYANALYQRGFVKEGYKSLDCLYRQSMNFDTSRIYPGIPEYFGRNGRGLYHYLTGAASWYMLTVVTEMFGCKGVMGDLLIEPKLLKKQFNQGRAGINLSFNNKRLFIEYINSSSKEVGSYKAIKYFINDEEMKLINNQVLISKEKLDQITTKEISIKIILD